tara:strand:- start:2843 stop:3400 length:558 start_codon:yes stop_codon:yes gene_type:complete
MSLIKLKYYNFLISIFSFALIISCKISKDEIINDSKFIGEPLGIANNIRMIYTDSTIVKAIMTAPIHIDYTNLSLKYSEFPDGVKVVFYDDFQNENQVIADYGILYNNTSIVDLRGNVTLTSHDKSILITPQLYWDADSDWIFTENKFTFKSSEYNIKAMRLDTNKEFSNFQTGELSGTVAVDEK